jgi:homoserine O-acetyltransferase
VAWIAAIVKPGAQGRATIHPLNFHDSHTVLRTLALGLTVSAYLAAANYPDPVEADWTTKNFRFTTGEVLPELRLHYYAIGKPVRDSSGVVRNAVLIMHGTTGSGKGFLSEQFGGHLFGPSQLLDATKYYIILPDAIGHGKSSKPSDGLHMRFPKYTYDDMVRADHLLLTEGLGVNHLRLVMGTSMGAMHSWVWGEMYPDFMDALMPLASQPVEIAGRNRAMRKMIVDALEHDPEWNNGEYTKPPVHGLTAAMYVMSIMTSSPLQMQKRYPTRESADEMVEKTIEERVARQDANDMIYAYESSRFYNPEPHLGKIKAPLLAINSADDQVNPPELGIGEREIKKVKHGRFILIPISDETRGHGTHSLPSVWGKYLSELLAQTALRNPNDPVWTRPAPEVYRVKLATTKGSIVLEVSRGLAPHGADRFYHLVEEGFYNDSRFFRVIASRFAQFGVAGDPAIATVWREARIPDDPPRTSNVRGTFAFAMTGPDARTTQVYINTGYQSRLDAEGFAPFGKIVEGMDVVDRLYSGYGERSGGGMRGGQQQRLFEEGNAWLDREFPLLDKILAAEILTSNETRKTW